MKSNPLLALALAASFLTTSAQAEADPSLDLDVNGDGGVDEEDFAYIESLIGVYDWDVGHFDPTADLDGDGKISAKDGNRWQDAFSAAGGADPSTPKPGVCSRNRVSSNPRSPFSTCNRDCDGDVDSADYGAAAFDQDGEARPLRAVQFRTQCDVSDPFVLVRGDIIHDADGAINILRDGVSQRLTLPLGGIVQLSVSGQSILYTVELECGRLCGAVPAGSVPGPPPDGVLDSAGTLAVEATPASDMADPSVEFALMELFPDGHQEVVMRPGPARFDVVE